VDLLQEIGMDEQETRLFLFNSALMQQEEPPPLQHYLESVGLDVFIDKFTSEGCRELSDLNDLSVDDVLMLLTDIGMDELRTRQFLLNRALCPDMTIEPQYRLALDHLRAPPPPSPPPSS